MIIKGDGFRVFYNGEEKTKEVTEQLVDYSTTVTIKGLDVFYSLPKKEIKWRKEHSDKLAKEMTLEFETQLLKAARLEKLKIQELLKEAEKHQVKNGGILQGVEFPFDTVLGKKEREQKVIEDWNKEANSSSKFHHILSDFTVGTKETEGKLDYELDWEFIQQMAERMGQNKGKYEPYNWKKLMDVEKLKQSLFRHVIEIMKSNYSDDGRELGHLESVALNALFINYQLKNNK